MARLGRRLIAEGTGTFFLTLVGAGADVIDAVSGGTIGHIGRYLAPGFAVTAMIYSLSAVSGAHINPAVTLAFVLRRTFPIREALPYVAAQCMGAIAAALLLRGFYGAAIASGVTHSHTGNALTAAAWETTLTALLVFVILSTVEEQASVGKNAALAIGFIVAACGLFSSPISGASMNPARSLGPALGAGDLGSLWAYLVGPLAGAAIAVVLAGFVHGTTRRDERQATRGRAA